MSHYDDKSKNSASTEVNNPFIKYLPTAPLLSSNLLPAKDSLDSATSAQPDAAASAKHDASMPEIIKAFQAYIEDLKWDTYKYAHKNNSIFSNGLIPPILRDYCYARPTATNEKNAELDMGCKNEAGEVGGTWNAGGKGNLYLRHLPLLGGKVEGVANMGLGKDFGHIDGGVEGRFSLPYGPLLVNAKSSIDALDKSKASTYSASMQQKFTELNNMSIALSGLWGQDEKSLSLKTVIPFLNKNKLTLGGTLGMNGYSSMLKYERDMDHFGKMYLGGGWGTAAADKNLNAGYSVPFKHGSFAIDGSIAGVDGKDGKKGLNETITAKLKLIF